VARARLPARLPKARLFPCRSLHKRALSFSTNRDGQKPRLMGNSPLAWRVNQICFRGRRVRLPGGPTDR